MRPDTADSKATKRASEYQREGERPVAEQRPGRFDTHSPAAPAQTGGGLCLFSPPLVARRKARGEVGLEGPRYLRPRSDQ
jgi:hypothetical protein